MNRLYLKSLGKKILLRVAFGVPVLRKVLQTSGTAAPITLRGLFIQKILGFNREAYWPMHASSHVSNAHRVRIGIGTAPGLSRGCYVQSRNGIEIGDYTLVAPNVGLLSANHNPYNIGEHNHDGPIRIGRYCWIGMNAVILPGVTLGDHTIVGAGAVVTHSFPDGYCILGGVPAKLIKKLDPTQIIELHNQFEYIGFHPVAARTKKDIYQKLKIAEMP